MRKTLILARREISGYFYSPVAYVIGAMFLLASGVWFFHAIFRPGQSATLRPLFEAMAYIMVFATPLLTMRLVSEEFRTGTFETLVTAPITDTQVILGKFLGVLAFYMLLLACTGLYMLLIAIYGRPDPGVAVMGYFGMVLLGAAYLAVGLFTSTLTTHQSLAAILSVAILSVFAILMQLLTLHAPAPWGMLASRLNAMTYFKDFARGMFDSRGVIFFVSSTAMFLFLSVKMLESRRWK
jgi:ABC-2 type transport system permease protein